MRFHHKRFYAVAMAAAALLIAGFGSGAGQAASADATAAARSAVLTLGSSPYGKVVFDGHHRALYLFAADHGTKSSCYGACASAWPPLLVKGSQSVGPGLHQSLLGATRRRDGSQQVTYGGHPLYYYTGDKGSGIACQHANMHGGFWYVVSADGRANMAAGHGMMMGKH
jgi:predicted lipoprotein with Yx(FWY)xxD motif